ncbi:unnamed protein product [Heligmosomoides polygyrus]|uniref:SPOC domain-containing protein n=1 Tax=Heligmosomoides polygyrus TaxID=6339 RepID=A0A183FD51_HELPZ|nr:unnamed protein product [Heligmosomoides polygyrus]
MPFIEDGSSKVPMRSFLREQYVIQEQHVIPGESQKQQVSHLLGEEKREDGQKESKKNGESWSKTAEPKKGRDLKRSSQQTVSSEDLQQKVDKNESGVVQETAADVRRDVPVTTVWNSAHVAEQKELLEGVRAASHSVSYSEAYSSIEVCCFRFASNVPRSSQEQVSNEKVLASLSTGASSEAGSMTEDFRLKEKLYKVKGLWSGEEKDTESTLPSNVAKVKPQPQSGAEHVQTDCKPAVSVPSSCHSVPPKSPGIAPFPSGLGGLMFSPYPVMFGDMSVGRGYTSIGSVVQPLIPPSNASSPPVCPPLYQQPPSLSGNPTMNQRQLPMRNNYFDQNAIFANNMPPSQNMGWNTGGMLDMLINMPPPIGTQRVPPFAIQYAGFAPPLTHPVHPSHNFSQPPPNVRFAQPPPPIHQDAQWEKGMNMSQQPGGRQQFTMFAVEKLKECWSVIKGLIDLSHIRGLRDFVALIDRSEFCSDECSSTKSAIEQMDDEWQPFSYFAASSNEVIKNVVFSALAFTEMHCYREK